MRRNKRWFAPLLGAIVAGILVAAVSLATDSTPSMRTSSTITVTQAAPAALNQAPPAGLALQNAFVKVVQSVSPSVVQIQDQTGLGSGIVLDAAGDIVTNNHVVSGPNSLMVTTSNGDVHQAKLVGSFPPDDLAVIKVTGAKLKPASFADSSKLQVGDLALAIGNPLGLRSSVTEGIVSAFRQGVQEEGGATLPAVIQTSAATNPGNSGSALVDIQGRSIGIPTLAATDPQLGGGSAPGIGFAIPSNLVKNIAGQIVANGKVVNSHRAFLGVRVGDTNGNGVMGGAVTAGGAAAKAGIRVGDVIVSVDGVPTSTSDALLTELAELKPGRQVAIVVRHQSGTKTTLRVTLGTFPGSDVRASGSRRPPLPHLPRRCRPR